MLLDAARAARRRPVRARVHRRGLRLDRRGLVDRGLAARAELAVRRAKAGSDLLALAYHRTHGLDVVVTRCSNNYGPYQFPEKVIPLFVTNLLDGRHGAALRRRRQRPRLAARRRPLPRHPAGAGQGPGRRGLQHRRRHRADQPRADRAAARRVRRRTGTAVGRSTDRKGHDRRYSLDITKISDELGLRAAGHASRTAWPRPSPGTATTAPGGSRSSAAGRARDDPLAGHRRRRHARPGPVRRARRRGEPR